MNGLPWDIINTNVLNVSKVLNDLLNTGVAKDVSWVYKEVDGTVTNINIPNMAKQINTIKSELTNYINDKIVPISDKVNGFNDRVVALETKIDCGTL